MKIEKILAIIAFISITSALYIISLTPPAGGYELSIYDAYPVYFWIFIIISIASGVVILVYNAFTKIRSNWWIVGFFITILSNLIVISLPTLRGYFISDFSDELTHLGLINDIALTGHIGYSNYYPVSHILTSILSNISGLTSRVIIKIVPIFFYLMYIIGLYILVKATRSTFGQVLLALAFGSVLIFTYYTYQFLPTQFSLSLVPLILTILLKKAEYPNQLNLEYKIIFLILLVLMPFLHPLGSIFLIGIFLLFEVSRIIYKSLSKRNYLKSEFTSYISGMNLFPVLIVFVIFITWFVFFAIFRETVETAYGWFVYDYGTTALETLSEQRQMAKLTILDIIDLIIKNYGHVLLFTLLSLVSTFIILRKLLISRRSINVKEIFFSLMFLTFSMFYISTLIGAFIKTGRSLRIFTWALMASTILNGMVLHTWISEQKEKKRKPVDIC